jgi:hypothetical protein
MREFFTSSENSGSDWLLFLAVLLLVGFAIACFVIWLALFRNKGKKRRKNRNRRRQKNPTLAETGGLPPIREEKKTDAQPPSS